MNEWMDGWVAFCLPMTATDKEKLRKSRLKVIVKSQTTHHIRQQLHVAESQWKGDEREKGEQEGTRK